MREIKKIILAGDGGVGRTTLLHRYVEGIFVPNTRMTIGCEFFTKEVEIEQKEAQLLFYDLSGQQRFRFSQLQFTKGAQGAILTFDLTRPMTLDRLEEWVEFLRTYDQDLPILLVGLKTDLVESVVIDDEYALYFKDTLNLFDYVKASCRTGDNVGLLFEVILRKILDLPELPHPYPDPLEEYQRIRNQHHHSSSHKTLFPDDSLAHFLNKKHLTINQDDIGTLFHAFERELSGILSTSEKPEKFERIIYQIIRKAFAEINISISLSKLSLSTESRSLKNYINEHIKWDKGYTKIPHEVKESIREMFSPLINTYIINEFLYLKYEHNKTNIYVDNTRFHQCKYLLMSINMEERESYHNINSIDEAAETLDRSLEYHSGSSYTIDPKTEFWGHCSNIEAWYENNYDTRILHRNLAFPLLRRLAEAGDQLAKQIFIEEIGKRFESGYPSVIHYLMNEGYLQYLNKAELSALDISEIKYRNSSFWEKLIELYLSKQLVDNALIATKRIMKMERIKSRVYDLLERVGHYYLTERLFDEAGELFNFILENNPNKRIFIQKKIFGNTNKHKLVDEQHQDKLFFLSNYQH